MQAEVPGPDRVKYNEVAGVATSLYLNVENSELTL